MAVTYEISGFKLDTANVCKVMEGTEYSSALAPRRLDLTSPGIHGEIPMWLDPLDTMKVSLRLRILKRRTAPQTELHDNVRTVQAVFRTGGFLQTSGTEGPIEVIRDRDGRRMRAMAQVETMSSAEYYHMGAFADMTVVLNIPLGVWQAEATEDITFAAGAGQGYPAGFRTYLPIPNPLIKVNGPVTSVTLKDVYSGTGIIWSRTPGIPSGQWLLIDPYNMNARQKTLNDFNMEDGTDARNGLFPTWNGAFNIASVWIGTTPTPLTGIDVAFTGGNASTRAVLRVRRSEA